MTGYTDDPSLAMSRIFDRSNDLYQEDELNSIKDTFKKIKRHLIIPEDIPNFRNNVIRIYFEISVSRPEQQLGAPPSLTEIVEIIDEENFDYIDTDLNYEKEEDEFIEEVKLEYLQRYSNILPDEVRTELINTGLFFTETTMIDDYDYFEKIGKDHYILNPHLLYSGEREFREYERKRARAICDR